MKGKLHTSALLTLVLLSVIAGSAGGADRWEAPFVAEAPVGVDDSVLTLQTVIRLVAAQNPLLPSLEARREAARGRVIQAGIWPNPEVAAEIEEVGWDAPGFDESEIAVSLSQEFELFGKRGARRKVAEAEGQADEFEATVAAFDLYLETELRYLRLAHAQEQYHLSQVSVSLAEDIVTTIQQRIDKGAALESELLLARLELQRAGLSKAETYLDIETAQISLTSLWGGDAAGVRVVVPEEPDFQDVLNRVSESMTDSTRELIALEHHRERLHAERRLAATEAKPNLTVSGGFKRLAADGSNSLMFGIALPLPFRNQNRGALHSLDAEIQQADFERQQVRLENKAALASGVAHLRQLCQRHAALDDELLPTAEEAYRTIQTLYRSGRLPYTSLLEANRSLVELRFEHNDTLLALREQIIVLERLRGEILQTDGDSNND